MPYLRECDPLTGEVIRASKTTAVRYERDHPGELVRVSPVEWWGFGAGILADEGVAVR